jgi:hypothetical protein
VGRAAEIVPSATAPLVLRDAPERAVVLSTVLPLAWPALVRKDGTVLLGLQVQSRGNDVSRDLAHALELALQAEPGSSVVPTGLPGAGARLQDLLSDAPLEPELHSGFEHWLEGSGSEAGEEPTGDVAASLERANASAVPTARLTGVTSAYWCRMKARTHLRWVMPELEEELLDALARLAAADALTVGPDTRYVGSFRAHGLLVPVWDAPLDRDAEAMEEPAVALRGALDEALADERPLSSDQRRARAGLLSRQLTLH